MSQSLTGYMVLLKGNSVSEEPGNSKVVLSVLGILRKESEMQINILYANVFIGT